MRSLQESNLKSCKSALAILMPMKDSNSDIEEGFQYE